MFGWVASLFTSKRAGDEICDTARDLRNGLDVLICTDEERIQYGQKASDQLIEFWKTQQDGNSVRSEARRAIATIVVCTWASYFLSILACNWLGLLFAAKGNLVVSKVFETGATQFAGNIDELSWIMGAVISFYFVFDEAKNPFSKMKAS